MPQAISVGHPHLPTAHVSENHPQVHTLGLAEHRSGVPTWRTCRLLGANWLNERPDCPAIDRPEGWNRRADRTVDVCADLELLAGDPVRAGTAATKHLNSIGVTESLPHLRWRRS